MDSDPAAIAEEIACEENITCLEFYIKKFLSFST
jgi:hypothetical protein